MKIPPNLIKKGFKVSVFLLPLCMGLYILKYGVDVPYLDEWDTPGNDFISLILGQFTPRSLIAQHNEHRPLFPRLIFLGLAQFGSWNVKQQMFVSLLWGCLTYWNIYRLLEYTADAKLKTAKWFGLFWIGLLLFSFSQRENWLWGMQLATFIPFLAVSFCTALAYSCPRSLPKYLGACSACAIATFSFANGLLTWVVVPPVLLWSELSEHQQLKRGIAFLTAWLGAFLLNVLLYFHNYVRPGHHSSYTYAFQYPLSVLAYFFSWLGGPLGKWVDFEGRVAIGGFFFAVFIYVLFLCYRYSDNVAKFLYKTIGWQTFALYTVVSGMTTALGRLGFGVEQSLSGRYVTFATPFYISLIGLTVVLVGLIKQQAYPSVPVGIFHHPLRSKFLTSMTFIAFILFFLSNIPGFRWGYVSQLDRYQGKTCLMFLDQIVDQQCVEKSLYPHYATFAPKAELLLNSGTLNVQRLKTRFPADLATIENFSNTPGAFLQLISSPRDVAPDSNSAADSSTTGSREYMSSGWVDRSFQTLKPDAVILAYRDPESQRQVGFRIAGLVPQFVDRKLTTEVKQLAPEMPRDGLIWTVTFADAELPESACEFSAWAFDLEQAKTWPLDEVFSRCG